MSKFMICPISAEESFDTLEAAKEQARILTDKVKLPAWVLRYRRETSIVYKKVTFVSLQRTHRMICAIRMFWGVVVKLAET